MVLDFGTGGIFNQSDVRETENQDVAFYIKDFCSITRSGTQTITQGSYSAIEFNAEKSDAQDMHSNSVDPERITIQNAGVYMIIFDLVMDDDPTGIQFKITKNATTIYEQTPSQIADQHHMNVTIVEEFASGDFIFGSLFPRTNDAEIKEDSRFIMMRIR
jgi:hypothetical protein|tara:strand:- start:300 stop:779 length:480 start_codon:yes stop_codon:yes gene_type:complete